MSYIRIGKNETCEITEKKSRFIAYLAYVTTEEDAQSFVAQTKKSTMTRAIMFMRIF